MTLFRTAVAVAALMAATAIAAVAAPAVDKQVKVAPGGLYQLVYNPTDKSVYVAATGQRAANNAAVVKLDAVTLAPKGSIDVSANPVYGLGINTKTQTLYGTDTRSGAVVVLDAKAGKQIATVKSPDGKAAHLREVVVDEATNKVYVSIVGGGERGQADPNSNVVWVIDGAKNTLEKVITVPTTRQTGLAVDSAGKRIFTTGMGANEVIAVSLTDDKVVGRYPSGGESPISVAVDSAGKRLFVANSGSGDLTVLNADTGALIKKVPTGAGALGVAFNAKSNLVYVTNRQAGTVSVVNGKDYTVAQLDAGTLPQSVVVDTATGRAYATNKARGLPRGAGGPGGPGGPGAAPGAAPAGPPPAPPEDPEGDTLTAINP